MSTRNLGCHYSLDGKSRRKPNPLKVLNVTIWWKTWQPNICYENMTEVDVRVKAEFLLFFFNLIIQMSECDLCGKSPPEQENLKLCTTEPCCSPLFQTPAASK